MCERAPMDAVPQRLSFGTLGTRNIRRARSFYSAWGWVERDGSTDDFASFDVGSVRLALDPLDQLGRVAEAHEVAVADHEERWGGYSAYIADPGGQRREIAWAP